MNIEVNDKIYANSKCDKCGYCFFCHLQNDELIGTVTKIDEDKRIHVSFGDKKWIFYNGEKHHLVPTNKNS